MQANGSHRVDTVVRVDRLTRHFGAKAALEGVSLGVPRGSVFGLVGENGAGKTTLIKHILGLLRAEAGSVHVFGLDPVRDCVGVLGKIGYLSEENDLPGWMRVSEFLAYMRAFYPKWDDAYAAELQTAFDLDPHGRLRNLSKGQRARVSLVAALAHRPDLLVLDEPSSGLDPIVRRDILGAIIRTIADQGRTVLFSSHLLDEVERVSDHVAMLHRGHVLFCAGLDDIKETHHRLTLRFETDLASAPELAGALACEGRGQEWTALCSGRLGELESAVIRLGARIVDKRVPSLDEIFVAQVGTNRSAN
jgi:ABC-2 type transport system ATP-binding protein